MQSEFPTIPENIVVHLGKPNEDAPNIEVPFTEYIKNVVSSEIYPTWPENAIRANVYAVISFALNRIYTEYYRSRGYDFDITNSTQFDQSYSPGRDIFGNISQIVDEIYNSYVVKQGSIQPYFTAFCNGTSSQCEGLSQWGTVQLANKGLTPYSILQNYFGDDIDIRTEVPVKNIKISLPSIPLKVGIFGNDVRDIQVELNRIRKNYPSIPLVYPVDGVFGVRTEAAVKEFQRIFDLKQDGIVGKATWYKIKQVFNGVKKLNELNSEGLTYNDISNVFSANVKIGDTGDYIQQLQYFLSILRYNYLTIPPVQQTRVYDIQTEAAVKEFQKLSGFEPTGIVDEKTAYAIFDQYRMIVDSFPKGFTGKKAEIFPGFYITEGEKGESVRVIKSYLAEIAKVLKNIPPVKNDDVFDQEMLDAVRAFQKEYGITMTGRIGPLTWNKIAEVYEDITM